MWLYPKQRLLQQYLAPHCGALEVGVVWDIIHLHPNDQQTLNTHFKSAKCSSLPIYQTDFTRPTSHLPLICLSPLCLPPWHRQWSPNCFPSLLPPLLLPSLSSLLWLHCNIFTQCAASYGQPAGVNNAIWRRCTQYTVQCSVFNVECSVYIVKCSVFSSVQIVIVFLFPIPPHPMLPLPHDHFSIAPIHQSIHQPTSFLLPFSVGELSSIFKICSKNQPKKKTPNQCSFRIVNSSMTIPISQQSSSTIHHFVTVRLSH